MSTALRTYYRGHDLAAIVGPGTSSPRYYHFDHQGTTQALTDAGAAVTDRFASDAWGVNAKSSGSSINRHWYVGNAGYERSEPGIHFYVRARHFVGSLARWLSRDSIPEAHRFRYVRNVPSQRVDPSGEACVATEVSAYVSTTSPPAGCKAKIGGGPRCCPLCTARAVGLFEMEWWIGTGGKPADCAVVQWVRDAGTGPWKRDDALGWPYPSTCTPIAGRGNCNVHDFPGLQPMTWPVCIPYTRSYKREFITCLCSEEGEAQCWEWGADFAIDMSACAVTRCNMSGPRVMSKTFAPESCRSAFSASCCCNCLGTIGPCECKTPGFNCVVIRSEPC
jgi:RHS repeat-associated protein